MGTWEGFAQSVGREGAGWAFDISFFLLLMCGVG